MFRSCLTVCALLGASLTAFNVSADQLADIKQKGVLVCGTLGTVEPFSFTNPKTRDIEGYDVDFCRAVADRLGVRLELKPISVAARIPELQQGRVDIVAAALGWTPERAEQIVFSDLYYASLTKIASRRADGLQNVQELAGKRVSASKGSTSEAAVKRTLPTGTAIGYQDPPAAFLALQQGKVDGIALGEIMLVKLQNQVEASAPIDILEPEIMREQWGLGMRKGETAFIEQVNATLKQMEASGEAGKLFDRWMGPDTAYRLQRNFAVAPIEG